ncbi:DNA-3-methyladenine glycosylase I [Actinomycetospora sp. NBRC 106378]|uniref:DNA-3-methyladenine glycosylase I n=1 Tax=Actinomycetospora sp. NBRC 106378 TaxID=3032208 RepID=UPI00249F9C9A|nr:DNA-3-methyladenine glycosylase I [Actinomycetospora sp. NBRC 106378]GLZ54304.1 DNA-3-methyladenine glycosylase I [Actinomycetospora sp. NBRC 106378]
MSTAPADAGDAVLGEDGVARCPWGAQEPLLREYHDTEWGHVLHGRDALYERLCLEAFQSGLSWLVILRKRPAFREAFARFDVEAVAGFDEADVERLLADAGIVRNRQKIEAAVSNAAAVLRVEDEGPGLDALLWSFAPDPPPPSPRTLGEVAATTPASTAMARELRRRGFRFVGPTTAHALMQATGMVDEHLAGCFRATR